MAKTTIAQAMAIYSGIADFLGGVEAFSTNAPSISAKASFNF
jgi:hypothetical protein